MSAHLEIVIAGVEHHSHVVDVGVEVVEQVPVVDVRQLLTGLYMYRSQEVPTSGNDLP